MPEKLSTTEIDLTEPAQLVKIIGQESSTPMERWEMTRGYKPEQFISRYVKKLIHGNKSPIAHEQLRVLDMVARSVVNRMQITRWYKPDSDGDTSEPITRVQVDEVDKRLGLIMTSRDLFKRAEVQGITYLMVWPASDGDIGIIRLQPDSTFAHYPEDGKSIWPDYVVRISKQKTRLDIFYEDRSTRWEKKDKDSDWEYVYRDLKYRPGWHTDMVPIIPFAPESFIEIESGIESAIAPQEAINSAQVIDAASLEFAGFPIRYTLEHPDKPIGSDAVDVTRRSNVDEEFDDDEDDDLDEQKTLDLFPGAFLDLWGDMAGEFKAAALEATMGRIDAYVKIALALSEVPLSAWDGTTANNSGELMRRELQPLIGKVQRRIQMFTASYVRLWELVRTQAAAEDGVVRTIPQDIHPLWGDPAQPDEMYVWELVQAKIEAGYEAELAFEEAGVEPAKIGRMKNDGRFELLNELLRERGRSPILAGAPAEDGGSNPGPRTKTGTGAP